jgi:hypothetical protein
MKSWRAISFLKTAVQQFQCAMPELEIPSSEIRQQALDEVLVHEVTNPHRPGMTKLAPTLTLAR